MRVTWSEEFESGQIASESQLVDITSKPEVGFNFDSLVLDELNNFKIINGKRVELTEGDLQKCQTFIDTWEFPPVMVPMVDDMGIDVVVRKPDGTFTEVQIKARSKKVVLGDASLFAAIQHEPRENYWFVFYSERMDTMWIMTSKEFVKESHQNKKGKNSGKRSIWFNGKKKNKSNGTYEEYIKPQFKKYVATDFSRIIKE